MPNNAFRTAATTVLIVAGLGVSYAHAADLAWEVVNPFRLYRHDKSFNLHQSAFNAVRGAASDAIPGDIIQRIERCLNDPDPADPSAAAACGTLARSMPFDRRLGWASSMVEDTCFNRSERPRRYAPTCAREGHDRPENYVLP
jgi:hypothetical protein